MTFSTQVGDASHASVYFKRKQPRGPRLCYLLSFGFGVEVIDNKLGTYLFSQINYKVIQESLEVSKANIYLCRTPVLSTHSHLTTNGSKLCYL